jgi:hypothetical protein
VHARPVKARTTRPSGKPDWFADSDDDDSSWEGSGSTGTAGSPRSSGERSPSAASAQGSAPAPAAEEVVEPPQAVPPPAASATAPGERGDPWPAAPVAGAAAAGELEQSGLAARRVLPAGDAVSPAQVRAFLCQEIEALRASIAQREVRCPKQAIESLRDRLSVCRFPIESQTVAEFGLSLPTLPLSPVLPSSFPPPEGKARAAPAAGGPAPERGKVETEVAWFSLEAKKFVHRIVFVYVRVDRDVTVGLALKFVRRQVPQKANSAHLRAPRFEYRPLAPPARAAGAAPAASAPAPGAAEASPFSVTLSAGGRAGPGADLCAVIGGEVRITHPIVVRAAPALADPRPAVAPARGVPRAAPGPPRVRALADGRAYHRSRGRPAAEAGRHLRCWLSVEFGDTLFFRVVKQAGWGPARLVWAETKGHKVSARPGKPSDRAIHEDPDFVFRVLSSAPAAS